MKLHLLLYCLLFSGFIFSQNDFEEADAKQIIDIFFEGFHSGDTLKIRSVLGDQIELKSAYTDKEGNHVIKNGDLDDFINSIGNRPKSQKWEERLLSYTVQINGNLAHVWTPYEFWFNDVFSHCGANAFTLARTNEGWKIINLIDSRQKENCKG